MFGRGIFNVDGEEWSQQRRVAASEFASVKLRDFSTNVFREYALKLASILQEFQLSQPSRSFNLQVRAPCQQTPSSVAWDFILQKQGSILLNFAANHHRSSAYKMLSMAFVEVDVHLHTCEIELYVYVHMNGVRRISSCVWLWILHAEWDLECTWDLCHPI